MPPEINKAERDTQLPRGTNYNQLNHCLPAIDKLDYISDI